MKFREQVLQDCSAEHRGPVRFDGSRVRTGQRHEHRFFDGMALHLFQPLININQGRRIGKQRLENVIMPELFLCPRIHVFKKRQRAKM